MANDGRVVIGVDLNDDGFKKSMNALPGQATQGLHKTTAIFETFRMAVNKVWSMIGDSVSSAMSRLDTMDQFGRVMETMLGSTEKANKALKDTTGIVTGTAFSLDTAAQGVQTFVSSGMEVSKATDTIAAWGDAVAFYTKGTNGELATVETALGKMQTKGTVTMEHMHRRAKHAGTHKMLAFCGIGATAQKTQLSALDGSELKGRVATKRLGVMRWRVRGVADQRTQRQILKRHKAKPGCVNERIAIFGDLGLYII